MRSTNFITCTQGLSSVDSARYTGFHYVDWTFAGSDMLLAIRTGYRGSNSFHNANRLTVLRLSNYSRFISPLQGHTSSGAGFGAGGGGGSVCAHAWRSSFRFVGQGWCRPTVGYFRGGYGRADIDCAQACSAAGQRCQSFALDDVSGTNYGVCVLYPHPANESGGIDGSGVRCYTKTHQV